jgi:hypothetical protein
MAGKRNTKEAAVKAAEQKTHQCEMERISVEVALRKGFDAARPDAKLDFFRTAISNMNLDLQDTVNLTYNYTDADKIESPVNVRARIDRVGKFVQDKCMSK